MPSPLRGPVSTRIIKWVSACGRVIDIKTQATGQSLTKRAVYVCLLHCVSVRFVNRNSFSLEIVAAFISNQCWKLNGNPQGEGGACRTMAPY